MKFKLDEYTMRARVAPALLVVLPAAFTVLAWSPGNALGWDGLYSLFVAAGGTLGVSLAARHLGKQKEKKLFKILGGRPSERFLSHAAAPNKVTLKQRHTKLARLLPKVKPPTDADEQKNPSAAFEVYTAWVEFLIGRTRDKARFPLLFEENCNYSFARNLWGMKILGLPIAVVASVVLGLQLYIQFSLHAVVAPLMVVVETLNILFVIAWLFFTAEWVRIPSEAYAQRLLEALDMLS